MPDTKNAPTHNGAATADPPTGKRPIAEIMEDFSKPIPERLLEQKPATGSRNSQMLTYVPWHRVQRLINHYTGGFCSFEVREKTLTEKHLMVTVRITIYAKEGEFYRDGTGIERLDVDSWGDPQSNSISQAFRRSAARFGVGIALYEGN